MLSDFWRKEKGLPRFTNLYSPKTHGQWHPYGRWETTLFNRCLLRRYQSLRILSQHRQEPRLLTFQSQMLHLLEITELGLEGFIETCLVRRQTGVVRLLLP